MKKQIISIALAAVLAAGSFVSPVQDHIGISVTAEAAAALTAPKASKPAGTYSTSGAFTVKLTGPSGADIYYSTGSSFKRYTKALKISKNTTLKCYSQKNGVKSSTVTYRYKLTPKVTFSADEGEYDSAVTVKLSSTASGVKFYYTLDGSKPTKSSTLYTTAGINITRTSTLRVMAVKSGWTSKYFTKEYTISGASMAGNSESILDDYTSKYAYNQLSSSQKKAYAAIFNAAKNHDEYADLSGTGITTSELEKAYWAFDFDNPQFFWLGNSYGYSYMGSTVTNVQMGYSRSKSEMERLNPQFEAAAASIIEKALAQDDLFDRVLVIHDAITEMTTYTASGPSYKSEADGPLLYGKALCEGYSKAFMYLCQSIGIQCVCVAGYGNGESHMWNMLQLDGEWYNMDVTWDDAGTYEYFCIPTSKMSVDHRYANFFQVPEATETKYSYSEVMGITEYTNVNDAYNGLVQQAADNWNNGVAETTVYVSSGMMNSLLNMVNKNSFFTDLSAAGCSASSWSAHYTDKSLTITLS